MKKINFAGGEPLLYPKRLAELCRFCIEDLELESVSIISNGTKIKRGWLEEHGKYVDVLGISCDSFDEETHLKIGRGDGNNVKRMFEIREWCWELGIKFKLNTVMLLWNWEEDMSQVIEKLHPFRCKVFQVLPIDGENDASEQETESDKRKRNANEVLISDEQFKAFCERHEHLQCFVPESNQLMASSYLIVDEFMRFLDKGDGKETASESILEVGVQEAMTQVRWDQQAYQERGAVYDWSKEELDGSCQSELPKELEW